jgi:hypothetical protein
MQNEITSPGPLLDASGALLQRGWARRPLLAYDPARVRGRLKEWDYYCVLCDDYGLALTVADLGYVGLVSVVWLDFQARTFKSSDMLRPFTRGRMKLPASSMQGDVAVRWGRRSVRVLRRPGEREIAIDWPRFRGREALEARLVLRSEEADDSLVVATPFAGHPSGFYYNQKVNCLLVEGEVRLGGSLRPFTPESSMGVLDWGRGVWPYSNSWYWGSASGRVDGRRVGWNIGYGFGDLSTHTENIVFIDGVGHKLDRVDFHIDDWLRPWRLSSNNGRLEMDFHPVLDRNADINLGVFRSMQHQVFGHYSGQVVLDDDSALQIERVPGFAEKVVNRW